MAAANLPEMLKPATDEEATSIGTRRAVRGEREERASIEYEGRWETRRRREPIGARTETWETITT